MKQRIITACIGLVVFFTVLVCFNSIIFDIAVCAIALIAVHELLHAIKVTQSASLTILCMAGSVMPFLHRFSNNNQATPNMLVYLWGSVLLLIIITGSVIVLVGKKINFLQLFYGVLAMVIVPSLLYILPVMRNQFGFWQGLYYTLLIFSCSWGADSGAYFAGRFLGKHKLAPKISPNKTVEGVYGGVASSILFVALITTIYYFVMLAQGQPITIHYLTIFMISVVGSLVGVMGDLTASCIKRHFHIKDYGSIMPGHGGVMDRFDSVLFVAVFILIVVNVIPV